MFRINFLFYHLIADYNIAFKGTILVAIIFLYQTQLNIFKAY